MNHKVLSVWMKLILIGLGISGLAFYFVALPVIGESFADAYPEYSYAFWPWLIFLWTTSLPCFAVLPIGWIISESIAKGKAFTLLNSRLLRTVGILAVADAAFYFTGNIVFLFLNINQFGIVLASILISFFGISVAVAAFALSSLTKNASDIREENELTI